MPFVDSPLTTFGQFFNFAKPHIIFPATLTFFTTLHCRMYLINHFNLVTCLYHKSVYRLTIVIRSLYATNFDI